MGMEPGVMERPTFIGSVPLGRLTFFSLPPCLILMSEIGVDDSSDELAPYGFVLSSVMPTCIVLSAAPDCSLRPLWLCMPGLVWCKRRRPVGEVPALLHCEAGGRPNDPTTPLSSGGAD